MEMGVELAEVSALFVIFEIGDLREERVVADGLLAGIVPNQATETLVPVLIGPTRNQVDHPRGLHPVRPFSEHAHGEDGRNPVAMFHGKSDFLGPVGNVDQIEDHIVLEVGVDVGLPQFGTIVFPDEPDHPAGKLALVLAQQETVALRGAIQIVGSWLLASSFSNGRQTVPLYVTKSYL